MKKALLFCFLLFGGIVFGQTHYAGLSLGGSIARVKRVNYDYYKSVTGGSFEVFHSFEKGKLITKSAFGYQQKGFSQGIVYVDSNGTVLGEGNTEEIRFNYLGLTQLVGIKFGEQMYVSFLGGLTASYYLRTKVKADQFVLDNGSILSAQEDVYNNLERLDLTAVIEANFGVQLNKGKELFVAVSYNHGIRKIGYRNYLTTVPWRNHYTLFRIGFRMQIGIKSE